MEEKRSLMNKVLVFTHQSSIEEEFIEEDIYHAGFKNRNCLQCSIKKYNLKMGSSGQEKTFHHSQLPEIFSSGSKPMWNWVSRTRVI